MAYTAFEDMRLKNIDTYKIQTGPIEPYLSTADGNGNDLKSAALRFIHNQCEKLNFDEKIAENEKNNRVLQGTGTDSGQIPYNMQMDINRLCLERELEHFIDSGVAEDAYNVYYCYLEIFFGRYGKSKKMVELLSEYESNGSSLLMKHRDLPSMKQTKTSEKPSKAITDSARMRRTGNRICRRPICSWNSGD